MIKSALICLFTALAAVVSAYENGGPITICNDPYPNHGHSRSLDPSPFQVTLSAAQYNPGDSITVTISSSTTEMEGFQIGAHSADGAWETLYGQFTTYPSGATPYKYYSEVVNCVTHGENFKDTKKVELTWIAPNTSVGDLMFTATAVNDFDRFWVNITAVLTAARPADINAIEPALKVGKGSFDKDLDLVNCGKSSGCVTYPRNCAPESCIYAVSYKLVTPDDIRFRLVNRQAVSSQSYVALGISADQHMDQDETFTCADIAGSFEFSHGYNPAMYNIKVKSDTNQVTDVAVTSIDGTLSCEFTRKLVGQFKWYGDKGPVTEKVDYKSSANTPSYYLYLACGEPYPGSKESVKKHKQLPVVSQSKVAFNIKERHEFYTLHTDVKVHVTFMVLAWCGTAAIAMIVSRYFKNGFINASSMLLGKKPWFTVHVLLASLTAVFSVIAFIIIFVFYMELTEHQLLHAGFGIAVMALTVLQILAGTLRPAPDAGKKRVGFNWLHRLSGLVTYILAVATMMIGTNIDYMTETLKTTGTGLLAGTVAVQVITAVVLELLSRYGQRLDDYTPGGDKDKSTNNLEIEEPKTTKAALISATHLKTFIVFIIYAILIIALITAFLVVLWID